MIDVLKCWHKVSVVSWFLVSFHWRLVALVRPPAFPPEIFLGSTVVGTSHRLGTVRESGLTKRGGEARGRGEEEEPRRRLMRGGGQKGNTTAFL